MIGIVVGLQVPAWALSMLRLEWFSRKTLRVRKDVLRLIELEQPRRARRIPDVANTRRG